MKDKKIRDIKALFEEDYYKPIKVGNFWNNKYIEYESKGNKNKELLTTKYLNEIKPYLKDYN